MSSILVVIPTVIEGDLRHKLLQQLQQDPLVTSVVVVDNGNCLKLSQYNSLPKVSRLYAGCNLNWLASCNIGAALALQNNFDYVCFLNDDVQLSNFFFAELLEAAQHAADVGLIVPLYTGEFCQQAYDDATAAGWKKENKEIEVALVDGTCIFLPVSTIRAVGFLDPSFKPPHWGADVDYGYRTRKAGLKLYVTHRSKLWHFSDGGGQSAMKLYGSREAWQNAGNKQFNRDLRRKYGPHWRKIVGYRPPKLS